jgi:hypothetical protein
VQDLEANVFRDRYLYGERRVPEGSRRLAGDEDLLFGLYYIADQRQQSPLYELTCFHYRLQGMRRQGFGGKEVLILG